MSLGVFLAVLFAAFLHAGWNAVIKTGAAKVTAIAVMCLWQGGIGLALGLNAGLPPPAVWPWLVASAIIHTIYSLFLAFAYDHGDLSRVYPISRGLAPLFVLLAMSLLVADRLGRWEVVAIIVLGVGILTMSRGVFTGGENWRLLPFAIGGAAATASYSVVDGFGVREWGLPGAYVAWMFVLDTALFIPVAVALRGADMLKAARPIWWRGAVAGLASYAAYAIVLWAIRDAPLALVAALRETSILFAVLIGWLLFGERMDFGKAAAALIIVGAVVLMRL